MTDCLIRLDGGPSFGVYMDRLRPFFSPDFICSLDRFKCDTNVVAVWSWEIVCSVMHMFLGVYRNECLISKAKSFPKLAANAYF